MAGKPSSTVPPFSLRTSSGAGRGGVQQGLGPVGAADPHLHLERGRGTEPAADLQLPGLLQGALVGDETPLREGLRLHDAGQAEVPGLLLGGVPGQEEGAPEKTSWVRVKGTTVRALVRPVEAAA